MGSYNPRVGTIRYMSPEVLSKNFKGSSFSSYLAADMYSWALVMWEICNRWVPSDIKCNANDYQLPYYEHVEPDPGFDAMEGVVCEKVANFNHFGLISN